MRALLSSQRAAFLLGSTAPDVQAVSGQTREETHFFYLPYCASDPLPWEALWKQYPEVRCADGDARTAFVAGYLCHLQADWLWFLDIFQPTFEHGDDWAPYRQRMYLHNVLRCYLDAQMRARLPDGMGEDILCAQPQAWLPFVHDHHLVSWRDMLARQFQPGAESLTVQVFAKRLDIPPFEFHRLLQSQEEMEERVFSRVPQVQLQSYESLLLSTNLRLLAALERCE